MVIAALTLFIGAQWEADVRLTDQAGDSRTSYNNAWCVAAGPSGSVHAVWWDMRDGNPEIYYRRSTDGGLIWEADIRLTSDTSNSSSAAVARAGAGVHVVWRDSRDGNDEIYFKRSTDSGATWQADRRITNAAGASWSPALAAEGSNLHLVWQDARDGNAEIYYQRSTNGGLDWNATDTRLTNDPSISQSPSVAAYGGIVYAVWFDYRNGMSNPEIYGKRSTDDGSTWGADTRLSNGANFSGFPSVAVTGASVHVVWRDNRDGNDEIYYKRSTDSGATWQADRRITADGAVSQASSVAASFPLVHMTFMDWRDGIRPEIYYRLSTDDGTSWGNDIRLTDNEYFSQLPSIAVAGTAVHVVWTDDRDGNNEIYYKRNPTGNAGIAEGPAAAASGGPGAGGVAEPNPFRCWTKIRGHEHDFFLVYDAAGKFLNTYPGNRIGGDLPPGIYFLRSPGKNLVMAPVIKAVPR